jgi:hypothetical protein
MIFSRPNKRDLTLIENLSKRGVLYADMIDLLNIDQLTFEKWKLSKDVQAVLSMAPKYSPERFTINHPDMVDQVEEAFEVGLIKFYRVKSELRLPTGRYKYHYKYLQENSLRIDVPHLIAYIKEITQCLTGKKNNIELGQAILHLHKLESKCSLPFDPELARKLAAVSFFTADEDLSTYDEKYGEWKIQHWKDHNFHDFFLTKPVDELLNLKGISIESLEEYLTEAETLMKDLALIPST